MKGMVLWETGGGTSMYDEIYFQRFHRCYLYSRHESNHEPRKRTAQRNDMDKRWA